MLTVEPQIVEAFVKTGQVKLVFRDVLNHGEYSLRTSEAARCAGQQGQFWQMHALLFERQDDVYSFGSNGLVDLMVSYAAELDGLDLPAFTQCVNDRAPLAALQAADAEQRSRGIASQPIFEIDGQRLFGLQSFEVMTSVIEEALK